MTPSSEVIATRKARIASSSCDVTDELIDASEELTAKEKAQAKILVTKACGDAPHAVLQAVLGLFTVMTGVSELLKTFFPDQHTELRGAAMGQWVGVGGAARCSAFAAAIVAIMYMGACKPVFNALGMEQQVKMCAPLQDFGGWTGRALQSIYAFGATVVANASGRGRSAFAATGLLYAAMTAVPAAVKALVARVWASFPDDPDTACRLALVLATALAIVLAMVLDIVNAIRERKPVAFFVGYLVEGWVLFFLWLGFVLVSGFVISQ